LRLIRCLALSALGLVIFVAVSPARALDAVSVRGDAPAIDLTAVLDHQHSDTDRIQVSTAPGPDGIVRRIEVRAREGGQFWVVFALANNTDDQIDRLIVAPHYRVVGSGLLWPDLGLSRIATITPSTGDRPDRQESPTADVFRITLDPGSVVTFVAEMRTDKLPQLYLWEPDAYKDKVNSFTLYQGIVIGISGLLALVLTILFVVKGSIMFPAAAALAWAVLVYIGVDFGFWGKVLDMSNNAERVWRAAGEAILAATLLVFLFAYLNLSRWHVRYSHITVGWLVFLGSLVALALFDPAVASGIARMSLVLIAFAGFSLIVYLSTHGFDRAVLLIPTWFLLVVWVIAAGMTVAGSVTNDIVGPALLGGLVLIVMLIGFTVMQHAFAGGGATTGIVSDVERRALALTGSGDLIWDWDVSADKVFTSPETESLLGLKRGTLEGPAAKWLEVLHPLDQDRFRAALDSVLDQRRGRLVQDFRLRTPDGHFMWFALKARPVVGSDGEVSRVVGTLTDVTEAKNAEERLLHDSVHDNLTGLPNRKLFIDRLGAVANFAKTMPGLRPTLMVIDLDRFKQVNDSVGIAVGDSILLTLARRLTRILKPQDTLARLAGDQFGLILLSEQDPARITAFAETIRKTVRAPIAFNDREIFLTASIGLALSDPQTQLSDEIIKDAELAMYHSKRIGGDRIDVYKPAMRARKTDRLTLESELRRAIERQEISILYQPIVRLEDRSIAGFEALARWDHPKLGRMAPSEFISIAEERSDCRSRHLRAGPDGKAAFDLAARDAFARADFCQRQRFLAAIAAARFDPRHPYRAVAFVGGARHAEARIDGIAGDGEPRARRADAHPHPRARHRSVARRFRHRPLLAGLSAALSVRHHQDRPVLRPHYQPRHAAADPEVDHCAGARPRHGRRRRRRGNRFRRGRALSARLRIRPRLCLRRADGRRRRDAALDRSAARGGKLIT
jgi:diguanylate cyclase (GGDEF)-like protein/PAS domain S-box-containing protein